MSDFRFRILFGLRVRDMVLWGFWILRVLGFGVVVNGDILLWECQVILTKKTSGAETSDVFFYKAGLILKCKSLFSKYKLLKKCCKTREILVKC